MNFSKRVFIVSLFAIMVIFANPVGAIEAGEPAPDFTLKSIAGAEVSLSDFKGRLVLLKLATTWCPTCQQLSGEIARAGNDLAAGNVAFLEVFVKDSEATVARYVEGTAYPMTFHALLDDGQVYEAYNIYLIPRLAAGRCGPGHPLRQRRAQRLGRRYRRHGQGAPAAGCCRRVVNGRKKSECLFDCTAVFVEILRHCVGVTTLLLTD